MQMRKEGCGMVAWRADLMMNGKSTVSRIFDPPLLIVWAATEPVPATNWVEVMSWVSTVQLRLPFHKLFCPSYNFRRLRSASHPNFWQMSNIKEWQRRVFEKSLSRVSRRPKGADTIDLLDYIGIRTCQTFWKAVMLGARIRATTDIRGRVSFGRAWKQALFEEPFCAA